MPVKYLCFCLLAVLVLIGSPAAAEPGIRVFVDGNLIESDVAPFIADGRTFVPLRAVAEAAGATVDWDGDEGGVFLATPEQEIRLRIGQKRVEVNGEAWIVDVAPILSEGRTFVPLRLVGEALGYSVYWLPEYSAVTLMPGGEPSIHGTRPEETGPEESAEVYPEAGRGSGGGGPRVVYLTFDDGPSADSTPLILDILKEEGVKATFFVIGENVERYPELVRRAAREGHVIGNHTYNHRYSEIFESEVAYLDSLMRTEEVIRKVLGEEPVRISRCPGGTAGHFTDGYYRALREAGYVTFDWNVTAVDSVLPRPSSEEILRNVAYYSERLRGREAIVLMHDGPGHRTTADALKDVIAYFRRGGSEFATLSPEVPLYKNQ